MPRLRTLTGLFRRFRSFVLGREVEIVGRCSLCGKCCNGILLQDGHWIRNKRQFDKLCASAPEHSRFTIAGKDARGRLVFDCSLQTPEGVCPCYEDRLPLCRRYPSKIIYYNGGTLEADCGFSFTHVTFRDVLLGRKPLRKPRFAQLLKEEIKRSDR